MDAQCQYGSSYIPYRCPSTREACSAPLTNFSWPLAGSSNFEWISAQPRYGQQTVHSTGTLPGRASSRGDSSHCPPPVPSSTQPQSQSQSHGWPLNQQAEKALTAQQQRQQQLNQQRRSGASPATNTRSRVPSKRVAQLETCFSELKMHYRVAQERSAKLGHENAELRKNAVEDGVTITKLRNLCKQFLVEDEERIKRLEEDFHRPNGRPATPLEK